MKKIILILTLLPITFACKSVKHCEAYGNKSAQVEDDLDISSSHTKSMSKYVTTVSIK